MSVFADNVQKLRVKKSMSQRALAEKLGVSKSTVGNWESSNSMPDLEGLTDVARTLGVSVSDLFKVDLDADSFSGFIEVPLYGSIAAGTPIEMVPVDETHPVPDVIHERYPNAFLLKVKGESMNRIIPNGSYVLVDPKQRDVIVSGQPYVVCVNGFDATVKRVKTLANGIQLIPDSDDPTYPVQTFDFADPDPDAVDATVIGRVVWYCIPFDWKF